MEFALMAGVYIYVDMNLCTRQLYIVRVNNLKSFDLKFYIHLQMTRIKQKLKFINELVKKLELTRMEQKLKFSN